MILFFIKLLLAHIIGDFVFQPKKWVAHKFLYKHKSKYLYLHILIHTLALFIILQANLKTYWLGVLLIIISHYIIDVIKLHLNKTITIDNEAIKEKNKKINRFLFFVDQFAHLIILMGTTAIYFSYEIELDTLFTSKIILFITAILILTNVSPIVMKIIFSKWHLSTNETPIDTLNEDANTDNESHTSSLEEAGTYIGILERLLVFCFIITNHWEGVGFLIAAKSIFRFGDLSKAKNRKLTEYVLIGTLLSFGFAILTGIGYLYLASLINLP